MRRVAGGRLGVFGSLFGGYSTMGLLRRLGRTEIGYMQDLGVDV